MPNIDRIIVNGTSYDIADATARVNASAAMTNADAAVTLAQDAVSYIEVQHLSDVQKETARDNIGAASVEDVNNTVSYASPQTISDEGKATARGNIGAASEAALVAEVTAREAADSELQSAFSDRVEAVNQSVFKAQFVHSKLTTESNWTLGNRINPTTGANAVASDCARSGYNTFAYPIFFKMDSADYTICVWAYSAESVSAALYAPYKDYDHSEMLLPIRNSAIRFRVGIRKLDGTQMTSSDLTTALSALRTYKLTDTSLTLEDIPADARETGRANANILTEITDITGNTAIPLVANTYIDLSSTSVAMENGYPKYSTGTTSYSVGVLPCSAKDTFTISGSGGSSTRVWAFIASDGTILRKAAASTQLTEYLVEAPENSAFIIVHTNDGRFSYRAELLKSTVKVIAQDMVSTEVATDFAQGVINLYGEAQSSSTRIHTQKYYPISSVKDIHVGASTPALQLSFRVYSETKKLIWTSDWGTNYTTVETLPAQTEYLDENDVEYGTIDLANGVPGRVAVTNRVRTKHYLKYISTDAVSVSNTYQYSARFYDAQKEYIGGTASWISAGMDLSAVAEAASVEETKIAYYKLVFRKSTNADILDFTDAFGRNRYVEATHGFEPVYFRFNVRYSDDSSISPDGVDGKITFDSDLSNHVLAGMINNSAKAQINNFSTPTGNCTIRAAKQFFFEDGTPPTIEWYLLEDTASNFYYSKDLQTREFLFAFSGNANNYSFGITTRGDIIACLMASSLPATPDPARSGYYIGNDSNRKNPYVFLAEEHWSEQHEVEFSGLKPCGWLGNSGFCNLPDGSLMFAEYTRATVQTCNAWKINGNLLDSANWVVVHSQTLSGSNSVGVKHYHAVMLDHYTGVIYLATGDDDTGAAVDYTTDGGTTWTRLSVMIDGVAHTTSEMYFRLVNFIFTPEYVYWASDTNISAKHRIFRAERDSNGILDYSTATIIGNLPRKSQDGSNNYLSTYANVYLEKLNAILFLERVDGETETAQAIDSVPVRLLDLSEPIYTYEDGTLQTPNVHEIHYLKKVSESGNWHLGFRYSFAEFYPKQDTVHVGFSLKRDLFQPAVNVNKGLGNAGYLTGNGDSNVNNLNLTVYKCDGTWGLKIGTDYI